MEIRFITPYSQTIDIGGEYNKAVSELPEDCYICLRDGDTLFLNPHWGSHIKQIIEANPEIGLIGCMTNRLRHTNQLYGGKLSDNFDIQNHFSIATELEAQFGTQVERTQLIAGLCLIFHKSLWNKVKFRERDLCFDTEFCRDVARKGIKIGIAKGLYLFHSYRLWSDQPLKEKAHLMPPAKF